MLRERTATGPSLEYKFRIDPHPPRERAKPAPPPPAPEPSGIGYLPAFLVSTPLPHSRPDGVEVTRTNGTFETTMYARNPPGLPYGTFARLMVLHLTTQAILKNSRVFRTAGSVNDMLSQAGIPNSGGSKGPSTLARDQLRRLAATLFTFTPNRGQSGKTLLIADEWLTLDDSGLVITLSQRFFDLAKNHAVALDMGIVSSVRQSALAFDLYAWITYRLARLKDRVAANVPWNDLATQLGASYGRPRDFRRKAKHALAAIQAAWPALRLEVSDRALVILAGPPSVPRAS